MNRHSHRGFTIIEVMLFLAVGGALTAGIMVSVGAGIAGQRYKDSAATFESDLQQQFESATSVVNNRVGTIDGCDGAIGRSNCIMLGTLTTVERDGDIDRYVVYGQEVSTTGSGGYQDEYQLLRDYEPRVNLASRRSSSMEWGTGIANPSESSGPLDLAILIVRSPQSGVTYAFSRDSLDTSRLSEMVESSGRTQRIICVAPAGLIMPEKQAVIIGENASSANSVETLTNKLLAEKDMPQC